MKRLLSLLGRILDPAWWHLRHGDQLTDLAAAARPTHRRLDLLRGMAKLERARWTPRCLRAVLGTRGARRTSDFMVDVFKTLDFEYVVVNPGTTVLALHESIVNYGGNAMPEVLTCLHEESAIALAHGYARMAGKPMLVLLHGSVGLHHAAMAIHHAKADRAPVFLIVGTGAQLLRAHNGRDLAGIVREDLKWDDRPNAADEFAASAVRAYKTAVGPPMGPVLLTIDQSLQEAPFARHDLKIPKLVPTLGPQPDREGIQKAAQLLVDAGSPLIVAHRAARTPAFLDLLVQLAETLQAPVQSLSRLNFPNRHPLAGAGEPGYQPDVVLLLETGGLPGNVTAAWPRSVQLIRISTTPFSRGPEFAGTALEMDVGIDIGGDAETALPALLQECQSRITPDRKRSMDERGRRVAGCHRREREEWRLPAAESPDHGPIDLRRLCTDLWPLIEKEDWSLVSCERTLSQWPMRLWNFDKDHRFIGELDQDGRGVNAPAAIGAALANRKYGRLSINLQTDIDLMYAPGILWTAAHHRIPLLTITLDTQAADRGRGAPDVHFAELARSLGMSAEGPIACPRELTPALRRGVERVKQGEPVLIEIRGRDSA